LQMKFSMSMFFYLYALAINLWHRKFVTNSFRHKARVWLTERRTNGQNPQDRA